MTGTGTQEKPFIPSTLTEFIEAAGTEGAFVELSKDIDAADDPEYTGELEKSIDVYGYVEGNGHAVIGVTVRANACLQLNTNDGYVNNVEFRNWSHKKTGNYVSLWTNTTSANGFKNCKFGMTVSCSSFNRQFIAGVFDHCSFDIECTGSNNTTTTAFVSGTVKYCNIYIHVPTGGTMRYYFKSGTMFVDGLQRCAVIFERVTWYFVSSGNSTGISSSTNQYSYILFRNCVRDTSSSNGWMSPYNGGSDRYLNIVCADGGTVTFASAASWSDAGFVYTTDVNDLKNKSWLIQVGFFP